MSWFGNAAGGAAAGASISGGNPWGAAAGAGLGIVNGMINNSNLESQMTPNGAPPAMIDPNSLGSNLAGYESRVNTGKFSPYGAMLNAQSQMHDSQASDLAQKQAAGGTAEAESALASKGGLSGGSAERLARGGAQDALMANQDIAKQGEMNRMGIGAQDQLQQNQTAGVWANMAAGEQNQKNALAIQNQKTQMGIYGGNLAANAALRASMS